MPPRAPTILCVDDEPIVLDSLREQFESQFGDELEIEVAQDAAEALEIVAELLDEGAIVPVVVSDHIMPGMKGDELLVRLRAILPDTRTILLTGQAGLDAVGRAVNEAGLYRYIPKPWDRDDLGMTLREAVKGYRTEMQVRAQQVQLARAHEAALRFVPHPYFELLGRSDLAEVRRGDWAVQDVGVYYSDLRSYTTLVGARGPRDNLLWINEYLDTMEGAITRHRGFVDDIQGDAVLAIFGHGIDGLVQAGVDSLRALDELNRRRAAQGEPPLMVGIGMNAGTVLMGVLGGRERLQTGIIGDAVNLAARVEGLTKHLGTHLVTEAVRSRLADPARFQLRYVDRVAVKGRSLATDLYEVLDGLAPDARERKLATAARLEEAVREYQAGKLAAAEVAFAEIAAADPTDRVPGWYRARIDHLVCVGLPADFDGTTRLDFK